jgi:hypothetical protein
VRVSATVVVPGRTAEAEALWYDPVRWASWIDGFGHVVALGEEWPAAGARRVWDSPAGGRGRVAERVVRHEARVGQVLEVEDERLRAVQEVVFAPDAGGVRVTLTLEWRSKHGGALAPAIDFLVLRPRIAASLRTSLTRFAVERAADVDAPG